MFTHRPVQEAWWDGFWRETDTKWEGASPQLLALTAVALAELVPTAPSRWDKLAVALSQWSNHGRNAGEAGTDGTQQV